MQWRVFRDRLSVAKDAFDAALKENPHFAATSAQMIGVLLGQGGERQQMEACFKEAITDDPDCVTAYENKLLYLTPKWHGTADDQLLFGRECLTTKRWDARIPFLVLQSQRNIVETRFLELCVNQEDAAAVLKAWNQALSELGSETGGAASYCGGSWANSHASTPLLTRKLYTLK